jgi:hypothetical protein
VAQWREPVVAPPLVVLVAGRTFVELFDETRLEEPRERAVERACVQRHGALGALRDVPTDSVAVLLAADERQQHVERGGREREVVFGAHRRHTTIVTMHLVAKAILLDAGRVC